MTTEAVYSSAQVARMLGVSGGMVRRYALALEELTGEQIPQHPRDGRQFTQAHVDALVSARRYVAGRQGMSVETGLRLALGLAELPAATLLPTVTDASGAVPAEALKTALGEHIGPLLTQLQALAESNMQLVKSNAQVAALRQHDHAELLELRARVAALEAEKTLHPSATLEQIDRALEVEMQASGEQEHLTTEATIQEFVTNMDSSPTPRARQQGRTGISKPENEADGPMVRAARWLERLLYRKG